MIIIGLIQVFVGVCIGVGILGLCYNIYLDYQTMLERKEKHKKTFNKRKGE